MFRLFRDQSARLKLLHHYAALVTTSDHMRREFIKHGFSPERVHKNSYLLDLPGLEPSPCKPPEVSRALNGACTLLFLGRMDQHKGGLILLDAVSRAAAALDSSVHLIFAGDGPERALWQKRAGLLGNPRVHTEFTGWLEGTALEMVLSRSDLLVVPSLWPEPFGRVGLLAGLHSLPVAGFGVGGIPEWLKDGINGHVASGEPPTATGLAWAIVKCLSDPEHYQMLRLGAAKEARRFNLARHLTQIDELFRETLNTGTRRPGGRLGANVTGGLRS
jgi:glycosyltransferase involved in cell wall biosynthesis